MKLRNLLSRYLMLPYDPQKATTEMSSLRGDTLDALEKYPPKAHIFVSEGIPLTLPPQYNRGYAHGFERAMKIIENEVAECREWIKGIKIEEQT